MFGVYFDHEALSQEIAQLESETQSPHFWNEVQQAEKKMARMTHKKRVLSTSQKLEQSVKDIVQLYELCKEEAKNDDETWQELSTHIDTLTKEANSQKIGVILNGQYDSCDVFLTIQSGAGGTESCDWVKMLHRMYTRWFLENNYTHSTIDLLEAEGGYKSITMEVRGDFCYGYLKAENGVHRLVRISPFDSGARRHTTFASVYTSPIVNDETDMSINSEDIRIDTYRASGAGGQHVNKTDSAVRITHLETGIVVQCQNERSQHKNKNTALKILKSKLYQHKEYEKQSRLEKILAAKKNVSWGNQIRSYVFHPYSMVKDHRTQLETGNTQSVMDGALTPFMEAYLLEYH